MAVVGLFPESSGTDDPDFELHLGEEVLRKGPGTVREWSEDGPKIMPEQAPEEGCNRHAQKSKPDYLVSAYLVHDGRKHLFMTLALEASATSFVSAKAFISASH